MASRNIRFIQAAISVVKSTRISPYSCKYSKKIFTQHQLLALVLFKDYRNQHYREFVEDVGDMEKIQEILDLSVIPHFTTLQKFLCRHHGLTIQVSGFLVTGRDPMRCNGIGTSTCTHVFESQGQKRSRMMVSCISVLHGLTLSLE